MRPSLRRSHRCSSSLLVLGSLVLASASAVAAEPAFESPVVTSQTPGHAVQVDVPLNGKRNLYLVVTDGGNGFACDWADWAEPRLVGPEGELKLTELDWTSATADWGEVRKNANAGGGRLQIAGDPVPYGIGTHANSLIHFQLPEGFERFRARAGLDVGGTSQSGGNATSVRFHVFLDKPDPSLVRSSSTPVGHDPDEALAGLEVAEGLEATLFAAEPMLLSPSNIDVDHRGRVWVCEVVNYRHRNGSRPEGDRILILEDTDGDGRADQRQVFYQGRDVDTALGICVLGNRVIVSVAPNVFVFTDTDGDDRADKKELLFSNVGQPQHDHSTHAFVFGPDGKLYWNFGNTGKHVHDRDGQRVVDMLGHEVVDNGQPYFGGMVFRCNQDGSEFEVLAHNFRNNYEVTVDSFGTLWQSDNDDDGNRGVRINYVMEYGNYGYRDERTGAGWRDARTGMHEEIPKRHWHLNDPGVVPNLLQTGQGSPTGICVYEGQLLPRVYWNEVVHSDAGPNVVRAYPVTPDGAGYTAEIVNILNGVRDQWFRPSDVCVAPDGSLIVADWYDPGVGGHRMGDIERGRIFRVAPPGADYQIPEIDLSTPAGAVEALRNPNLETRYLAWTTLHEMQSRAVPALETLYQDLNPRMRARALWLLGKTEGLGQQSVDRAIEDADPNLRITGLRLARQLRGEVDVLDAVRRLVDDPNPAVRRECAIALHRRPEDAVPALWTELALRYDGADRWYLEALGIGAAQRWDACLAAWLERVGDDWNSEAGRDILWRSRADVTPEYLARLLQDPQTPAEELPRYLRAFDFLSGDAKREALVQLALKFDGPEQRASLVTREAVERIEGFDASRPEYRAALDRVLAQNRGTSQFVALVNRFHVRDRYPALVELAAAHPEEQVGIEAAQVLLGRNQRDLVRAALTDEDPQRAEAVARALANSADARARELLEPIMRDEAAPLNVRRAAVAGVARSPEGARGLLKSARTGSLDPRLKDAAVAALHGSSMQKIREAALELFPPPPGKNDKPLPPLSELVKQSGNPDRGRLVFNTTGTCNKCHVVNDFGKEVGPNLSEIGSKLSREAFFQSILYPSAGISHNYENYLVLLNNGTTVNGVITSQTDETVSLKGADAIVHTFQREDIEEMVKQDISLMPADIQKLMTEQELVDVVEYLTTLKKADAGRSAAAEGNE